MKFDSLKLIEPILRAVQAEGYETPTPIQTQAIPLVLERKDVLACAQTGTGKTAAFALPILQVLAQDNDTNNINDKQFGSKIRVLVLTPTRELASQISQSFSHYGRELPLRNAVIFGGVGQKPQVATLRKGIDILVATPGRLLDLMQQRLVHFDGLQILVLDEADRMLDMGFIRDVRKIISALPRARQTLFFSATMPPEIRKLSEQILSRPVRIEVTPVASTAEKIEQAIYQVEKRQKTSLLIHLLKDPTLNPPVDRALVFTRTKREANQVSDALNAAGIRSNAIHGNKSQGARERALESIKKGECRILVATDIAARGIDIDKVTHVFNHDIPNISESYVHRIGRTARAGTEGSAFSFCSREEAAYLSDIERLIRKKIPVLTTPDDLPVLGKVRSPFASPRPSQGGHNRSNREHGNPSRGHQSRSGVRNDRSQNDQHSSPRVSPAPTDRVIIRPNAQPVTAATQTSEANNRRARREQAGLSQRWAETKGSGI